MIEVGALMDAGWRVSQSLNGTPLFRQHLFPLLLSSAGSAGADGFDRIEREGEPDDAEGDRAFRPSNGSPKASTAMRNWPVGAMYWRKPTVARRSLRAALANQSRGIDGGEAEGEQEGGLRPRGAEADRRRPRDHRWSAPSHDHRAKQHHVRSRKPVRDGVEHEHLDGQADERLDVRSACGAGRRDPNVKREGEGDPRQVSRRRWFRYPTPTRAMPIAASLERAEAFVEDHRPQRDAEQGIDVVAQAGLERPAGGDGEDEQEPVVQHEQGGEGDAARATSAA
jgi:hypothetical protein